MHVRKESTLSPGKERGRKKVVDDTRAMDIFLSPRLRSASMVFGTAMKSESKSCLQEHV
jgi:hypothetical protein